MFKLICLIVGLCIIAIPNCSSTPVANEENHHDLELYYEELKKNADLDAKPCDDYSKYACGKISDDKDGLLKMVEYYFINNEPKHDYENKVRDMYLSCKRNEEKRSAGPAFFKSMFEQVELLKNLDSYPTKREFSAKEISEIAGALTALGDYELFYIDDNHDDYYVLNVLRHVETYPADGVSETMVISGMTDRANAEAANSKVSEFVKKLKELYENKPKTEPNSDQLVPINSLDELKNLLPSTTLDWEEFYNAVKPVLSVNTKKKDFKLNDVELIKKVVELINQTDKNTLMNYFVFKYISLLGDLKCRGVKIYYRPAVLRRIWDENLTPKDIARYTEFLNELENSLTTPTTGLLKENIRYQTELRRDVLEHHKTLLSEEFLNTYYNHFEVDPNNFYKNAINFLYLTTRYYHDTEVVEEFNSTGALMFYGQYDNVIDSNLHDKPYYYYYSVINYNMWYDHYRYNSVYENIKTVDECLAQQHETSEKQFENGNYMAAYAAQVVSYLHYNRYSDAKENSHLYQETQYLMKNTDIGNPEKLYYMGLAQYECHHGRKTAEDRIFRVFRNTKQFSEAYNCPDGSAMHKYENNKHCVLEECHNENPLHQYLWPYQLPVCQRLLKKILDLDVDVDLKVNLG